MFFYNFLYRPIALPNIVILLNMNGSIVIAGSDYNFVTGTVVNSNGNVEVVSE